MATPGLPSVPPPRRPFVGIRTESTWVRLAQVLGLLFIFLVGIRGLGTGFQGLGHDLLQSFFLATDNPLIGLMVGMLATSLVQSSSVTTSMVVALVAAPEDPLPLSNAIPMVMGANIGTTVTNTIVSMGHITRAEEFRRAVAAATCHDFFNTLSVLVLLPLELATGFLEKGSAVLVSVVGVGGPGNLPNPIKSSTKAVLGQVEQLLGALTSNPKVQAVFLIVLSVLVIFATLYLIVKVLRSLAETKLKVLVTRSFGKNAFVGMLVGAIVTVMVQSSSITTSVMVPLAAAGIVNLRQVFPITIGANIGTTVTALLASMAAPQETAHLAVQIALVHMLFNMTGALIIYPLKVTRQVPLRLARWFAGVSVRSKKLAIVRIVGIFYGLPALLIFLSRML